MRFSIDINALTGKNSLAPPPTPPKEGRNWMAVNLFGGVLLFVVLILNFKF
jgi:hypothetical protein